MYHCAIPVGYSFEICVEWRKLRILKTRQKVLVCLVSLHTDGCIVTFTVSKKQKAIQDTYEYTDRRSLRLPTVCLLNRFRFSPLLNSFRGYFTHPSILLILYHRLYNIFALLSLLQFWKQHTYV